MEKEQIEKISQIFNKIIDEFGVETDKYEREDAYFGIIDNVEKGMPLNEAVLDAIDVVYPTVDINLEGIDEIIKSCDDSKEVQEKVNAGDTYDRSKVITDLASERPVYAISSDMEYGFSDDEIARLACAHKFGTDYMKERVFDLLEDCNFHTECADFEEGKYDAYISQLSEDEYKETVMEVDKAGFDADISKMRKSFDVDIDNLNDRDDI